VAAQEPAAESKGEIAELKIPGKKVALYGVVLVEDFRKALITNLDKKGKEGMSSGSGKGKTVGTYTGVPDREGQGVSGRKRPAV
jgi:hypothetical protein